MKSATTVPSALRRGWQVFGGLAAAVLLLPVPALALTFNGSWTPTTLTSGGPKPTTPTFTDSYSNAGNGSDNVDINMGNYTGATSPAVSSITLARSITVPEVKAGGESIEFLQQLVDTFTYGGVTATVSLFNSKNGKLAYAPMSFSGTNTGGGSTKFSDYQFDEQTIAAGAYTLTVKVVFSTNNKIGTWKQVSQYNFQIDGE